MSFSVSRGSVERDAVKFIACRPEVRSRTPLPATLMVVRVSICGAFFGSTTTLVPTSTRPNRSLTSSLVRRMQPDETNLPIVEGSLVP